jgi:hypothetical protein
VHDFLIFFDNFARESDFLQKLGFASEAANIGEESAWHKNTNIIKKYIFNCFNGKIRVFR